MTSSITKRMNFSLNSGSSSASIASARQIERLRALAIDAELDPEFSEKFIRFVIEEVIRHHQRAAGN